MLLKLFSSVRSSELSRFKFFLVLAGLLFCSQTTAMTVCESLLLTRLGLSALPPSVLAASALTMICSFAYSKWVGRHRHEVSLIRLITVAVVIIILSVPLVFFQFKAAYVAIFAFHFVTFTIWSGHLLALANDYFDTLAAKRVIPLIGVGATMGEISGGLASSMITRFLPIEALLIAWAGLLVAAAVFTHRSRPQLELWNPHPESLMTADETTSSSISISSLLKQSALNRSLLGMVCFMILTMSMVQYVVSDVFVTTFPKDADLASFLGIFVAFCNSVELIIATQITPRLLSRFGVARTNTVHALLALVTLFFLWNHYALIPAALAWMNRKTIHDALAGPARRLVFNAIPLRERTPLLAFIMGVAGSAARATASVTLLVLQGSFPAKTFVLFGFGFGALYLVFVLLVARCYLTTLLREIKKGRLSLFSDSGGIDKENLSVLWEECLRDPKGQDLAALVKSVRSHGRTDLLKQGALMGTETLRVLCIESLKEECPLECLKDPAAGVRRAAIEALWRSTARIGPLCQDSEPEVRRLARAICGLTDEPGSAVEIKYLHADNLSLVKRALEGESSEEQIAALFRLSGEPSVPLTQIHSLVDSQTLEVSLAAIESLAGWDDPMATVLLARCLAHENARIRQHASEVLSARHGNIIPHVEGYFRSEREVVVRAAYQCFDGMLDPRSRELLGTELRIQVREAWKNLALLQNLRELDQAPFLCLALRDRADRCERLAFRLLALLEGEDVVSSVLGSLRFSQGAGKSTALEVLSNLGDREAAGLLVLLTEPAPLPERLSTAKKNSPRLSALATDLDGIRAVCLQSPGRFVTLGARQNPPAFTERLLRLHQFDVLRGLSLEDLEQVDRVLLEERFGTGEAILSRGEVCPKIYLIMQGDTDAETDILGEVNALDQGPSLTTVKAKEPTDTYSLTTASLKVLIRRQPSVAFPLIARLTKRLRAQEQ